MTVAQNIYDDAGFSDGYSRLPRSVDGLDGAAEWPAMQALLPDLRGLRVVDLGCGFGWFCRWAVAQGASRVLGVDLSENMLERARSLTGDPAISYVQADLERLALAEASFDLAYSSLALHYVTDVSGLLATVHRALCPGGPFVLSIEHPIYMAPTRPGWSAGPDGQQTWPVDSYLVEGPRITDWLADGVVKQHRTIGTTLNCLIRNGFVLCHVEEWGPNDAQIALHPDWAEARQRPMFLLIAARRSPAG